MIEFLSSLLQAEISRTIFLILVSVFAIVSLEVLFCVIKAMTFQVEKLPTYRNWFMNHYRITAERNKISWKENKHNWLLWASVLMSNVKLYFASQSPYFQISSVPKEDKLQILKHNLRIIYFNVRNIVYNSLRYLTFLALVPIYLLLIVASVIERLYRFLLEPIAVIIFWILAKIKEYLTYHFRGKPLIIHGHLENVSCPADIVYRKPFIQFHLYDTQYCPDYLQKDNLNHFTSTLKSLLPPQRQIRIKAEVHYWKNLENLETELPLTIDYLRASFSRLTYIQTKQEVSL